MSITKYTNIYNNAPASAESFLPNLDGTCEYFREIPFKHTEKYIDGKWVKVCATLAEHAKELITPGTSLMVDNVMYMFKGYETFKTILVLDEDGDEIRINV